MTYKEAFKNIRSDYRRYSELYPNGGCKWLKFFNIWIHERGFVYIYSGSA